MMQATPHVDAVSRATAGSVRDRCSYCGTTIDPATTHLAAVPSNVRRHMRETFHLWRCPTCRCIHCLEHIDLAPYYDAYPIPRSLTVGLRQAMGNLVARLTQNGLTRQSRVLDYGCGPGLFLAYLREQGYANAVGYDPFSAVAEFRDRDRLSRESFDYVVLQDVIEHVEDPREVLGFVDQCVKPGGRVLVGTPNASELVTEPYARFWMHLHPPYHVHIYTHAAVAGLGVERGWTVVDTFNRSYLDSTVPGLNMRAITRYQWFGDGTLDAAQEAVPVKRLRRSPWYLFLAYFGYWWRRGGDTTVIFEKPGRPQPSLLSAVP